MRAFTTAIMVTAAMAAQEFSFSADEPVETCWVKAYGRGVGKEPDYCDPSLDKNAGACYKPCERGYDGRGPQCWSECPWWGFRDDGNYCHKEQKAYPRGPGSKEPCEGCEEYKGKWYPKCDAGYHNVGCCSCSHDCPKDWKDIGISCEKIHYKRDAGIPLSCEPGNQKQSGLCYPECEHDARANGPVCWGNCPEGTRMCGGTLCLTPDESCHNYIDDILENLVGDITAIAQQSTGNIDISKIAEDFTFPVCDTWGVPKE